MAITISFPANNVTTDLSTNKVTFIDGTTYTSPVRTSQGVFFKVAKVDVDGTRTILTTTPNNSDPASASTNTWVCNFIKDGWYQGLFVAAPTYSAGVTYAIYDAVYDPGTKLVYRSKVNSNLGNAVANTTFWELIPDATTLALNIGTSIQSNNLNTNTSATIVNFGLYPKTKVAFGESTGNAFLEATSTYKRSEDVREYELLGLAVAAMQIADSRQEYSSLELYARRAASIFEQ